MCSYISLSIDGGPMVPACANRYLLQTVTREYWNASLAYHTSDCGAVQFMKVKGFTKNDTYSAAAALNGGMDLNSNTILPSQLTLAQEMGLTNASVLAASLQRTLHWRFALGQLDPLERQAAYIGGKTLATLGSPANRAVALEGAAQGLVLAKNGPAAGVGGGGGPPVLPLARGGRVALLGPLGSAQEALLGDYYADSVCPGDNGFSNKVGYGCVPTLAAALAAANVGGSVVAYSGVSLKANDSTWGAAIAAAAAADAVVVALGTDRTCAAEGGDLTSTSLPGLQGAFARAVAAAAGPGKPLVLLLISSFPLALEEVYGSFPAVVLAYNPGFGAAAVASALFEGGANRWGRSVFTHYPAAYTSSVALTDFGIPPSPHSPGRTYRYYNGGAGAAPVVFGQGLSYNELRVACSGAAAGGGVGGAAAAAAAAAARAPR